MDKFETLLKVVAEYKAIAQGSLESAEGVGLNRAQGAMAVLKEIESKATMISAGQYDEVFGDEEKESVDK